MEQSDTPGAPRDGQVSMLMVTTIAATLRYFLLPYASHFRNQGWRVDACATNAESDVIVGDVFDHAYEFGITRSIRDVKAIASGYRQMREVLQSGYDIVHVHTPIAAFVTRAAVRSLAPGRRPRVVYTAHGFHFHEGGRWLPNFAFATGERVAGRWTDRLVVINEQDRDAVLDERIVPRSRLRLMPGIGVDTDWYSRERLVEAGLQGGRARLGLAEDLPMFVVVAELSERKRPLDVVRALAGMEDESAHLVLLGEGPQRDEVEAEVSALGLRARVHLLGQVDDIRPMVADATALVLASSREGLPRSIMEAYALGVPVVTTDARGNEDLVTPADGICVGVGEITALAAAMDRLAADPALCREMGARGRARMIRDYELAILIAEHERLYAELLAADGFTSSDTGLPRGDR